MVVQLAPLNKTHHGTLKMKPLTDFTPYAKSNLVSLYGTEVPRMAQEFPIVFLAEPEGFFPGALLALSPEQNLFVDAQGRWLAGATPAVWRRGCFRLAKTETGPEWVLCVDEHSPLLNEAEGQPLFGSDGEVSELVKQVTQFLGALERDRIATLALCATLDRHGLITPWDLKVEAADGQVTQCKGLYRIDEAKMTGLSAEALAELRDTSALPVLYAHLFSLHRLGLLAKLQAHRNETLKTREAVRNSALDLDQAFGIVEDDPFIFGV